MGTTKQDEVDSGRVRAGEDQERLAFGTIPVVGEGSTKDCEDCPYCDGKVKTEKTCRACEHERRFDNRSGCLPVLLILLFVTLFWGVVVASVYWIRLKFWV